MCWFTDWVTHNHINYVPLTVELGSILHTYSTTCFICMIIYLFLNLFTFIIKHLYYFLCQQQPAYKVKGVGGLAREADSCVCGHLICWWNINKNYGFQFSTERKAWLFWLRENQVSNVSKRRDHICYNRNSPRNYNKIYYCNFST